MTKLEQRIEEGGVWEKYYASLSSPRALRSVFETWDQWESWYLGIRDHSIHANVFQTSLSTQWSTKSN